MRLKNTANKLLTKDVLKNAIILWAVVLFITLVASLWLLMKIYGCASIEPKCDLYQLKYLAEVFKFSFIFCAVMISILSIIYSKKS